MVLYAVLLLSLLSGADSPLSLIPLSLSFSVLLVCSPSLISFFIFFLWVPVSRFRLYYEKLRWNKTRQYQMFILFFSLSLSLCHSLSLILSLCSVSNKSPCCEHVFLTSFVLSSSSHTHCQFSVIPPILLACFNLLLLCLLSIRKPHSYLIEGPCPCSQRLN